MKCIINSWPQVIAILDGICKLALIYNSKVILNMQSANRDIDKSLGLTHNIPFLIGNITLHLKVYIIHNPTYNILLGQPMDILTKSFIKNFSNGVQTIMISNPNTSQKVIIPIV